MPKPVTVYLDSQDFSRFSSSHSESAEYLEIRRELIELKREGLARFVFSDVHVFEALPTDPGSNAAALERIRTIAEFCGRDHLPSACTLVEHEVRKLMGDDDHAVWPEWYPHFDLQPPHRRQIGNELVSKIGGNRKQRRALLKAVNGPGDARTIRAMVEELLEKYPFLQGGRKVLRSYFSHQVGWDAVERLLRSGMGDIVGFSEWLVANWAYGQRFVAGLREGNLKFQNALVQFFDNMRTLFEGNPMTENTANQIVSSVYAEQRRQMPETFVRTYSNKVLGICTSEQQQDRLDTSRTPSLFTALQFAMDVAYLSALPKQPRNPHKRAGSDFADALHILFLPMVDVFRADRFSCSVLQKNNRLGDARLCSSLVELPTLIGSLVP